MLTSKLRLQVSKTANLATSRTFCTNFRVRYAQGRGRGANSDQESQEYLKKLDQNFLHGLPYDILGTHQVPKLDERQLIADFMDHKQIDEEVLVEKFHDMVSDFYSAVAKNDQDHLKHVSEQTFANKVIQANEQNRSNGLKLQFEKNDVPLVERAEDQKSYFFDKLFEKGMLADRSENDANQDYFLDNQKLQEGIRYYQHKYFAGYETYYYLDRYAEKVDQDDLTAKYQYKYYAQKRDRSIVFRIFGLVKDVGRFTSSQKSIYSDDYTGNHLVIFENQLIEPPSISLCNPNVESWLKKHKINHDNWKIADIDNYMKGNPFFSKILTQSDFKEFVEKIRQSKQFRKHLNLLDEEQNIKSHLELAQKADEWEADNAFNEPTSNKKFTKINQEKLGKAAKNMKGRFQENLEKFEAFQNLPAEEKFNKVFDHYKNDKSKPINM